MYILEEFWFFFFSSTSLSHLWDNFFPDLFFPSLIPSLSLSCCHSEQIRLFQHSKFSEPEKKNIEEMIESNKKWLKGFKKDSKVYLLPGSGL